MSYLIDIIVYFKSIPTQNYTMSDNIYYVNLCEKCVRQRKFFSRMGSDTACYPSGVYVKFFPLSPVENIGGGG